MKRKIMALSVIVVCLAIMASGTAAYFTTSGRATNIVTMGTIALTLDEQLDLNQWEQVTENEVVVSYKFKDPVMPGETVDKNPIIVNSGGQPYFLRYRVDISVVAADKQTSLPNTVVRLIDENPAYETASPDDGWKYFVQEGSDAVAPNTVVELFDGVLLAPETTNEYQGCTVTISVRAQAVQSKNQQMDGAPITDAVRALGWPAE